MKQKNNSNRCNSLVKIILTPILVISCSISQTALSSAPVLIDNNDIGGTVIGAQ